MRGAHLPTAILGAALCAAPAFAVELERLVMPGAVVASHQDVESDCGACHRRFERGAQAQLCLDCHEEVAADRSAAQGFHGRLPAARDSACAVCHTEHRGRDADITGLDRATFEHGFTDFALEGAHAGLICAACHAPDQPFRAAGSDCAGCHRDAEPHRGRLGTRCQDCHDSLAWQHVRFDHGTTGFALAGRHAEAACAACHPNEGWQDTPDDCVACHREDDIHRGTQGARCGDCHAPQGWETARFDHDRDTRFPLRGAHRTADCATCHRSDPQQESLPVDCYGCHRADDDHRGANGRDCGSCHGSDAWAHASFEHDRDTDFPLRGAHRSAGCGACHAGPPREVATDAACVACHAKDDVHGGQQGADCAACHDAAGWRSVRFDHELTRFPLLGMHAAAGCEECHASHAFRDAASDCAGCHRGDDAHAGGLGPDCQRCHNPNDWQIWEFDHELETRFALDGAHQGLACDGCHRAPLRPEAMRGDCGSCHVRDDVHRGALGVDCGRCHAATRWAEVRVR
jgi:hypothetical protein